MEKKIESNLFDVIPSAQQGTKQDAIAAVNSMATLLGTTELTEMEKLLCQSNPLWLESIVFAHCNLVPKALQPKQRELPTAIFLMIGFAKQHGLSYMDVFNEYYIVDNKICRRAESLIRDLNNNPRFDGGIKYQFWRDDNSQKTMGCRAYAIDAKTGEQLLGSWVTYQMATDMGWTRNAKWQQMGDQMLMYRAATFFARAYGETTGVYNDDEIMDIRAANSSKQACQSIDIETGEISGK